MNNTEISRIRVVEAQVNSQISQRAPDLEELIEPLPPLVIPNKIYADHSLTPSLDRHRKGPQRPLAGSHHARRAATIVSPANLPDLAILVPPPGAGSSVRAEPAIGRPPSVANCGHVS